VVLRNRVNVSNRHKGKSGKHYDHDHRE
jgi:hypothetical protein